LVSLFAVSLTMATAPSVLAQSTNPNRLPFMMYMAPGSNTTKLLSPTSTVFTEWFANGASWQSSPYTGSDLVIKHMYITWSNGPVGSALFVQMTSCYDDGLAGGPVVGTTRDCSLMIFQTPPLSSGVPYVTANFPVLAHVPISTQTSIQSLLSFSFSVNGSSWSSTPPSGAAVTVAGYFEPI
jgi:hypothetical protein